MKNMLMHYYHLPAALDNKQIKNIVARITAAQEKNEYLPVGVIISASDEIYHNELKYAGSFSSRIPENARHIIKNASRQISASMLLTALKNAQLKSSVIDCTSINLNLRRKKVTDRFKNIISYRFKKKLAHNGINILIYNKFPFQNKKIPSYYQ
ncbi:MAG TPA: hypothetical protein VKS21_05130, partial [Spirochaetota bacterium]|nr:hypothetical protein [Spirochaetota bacterium]